MATKIDWKSVLTTIIVMTLIVIFIVLLLIAKNNKPCIEIINKTCSYNESGELCIFETKNNCNYPIELKCEVGKDCTISKMVYPET